MKISVFDYPNVERNPDESYHDENRAWQGAPSIALTRGGRLFVAIMSGGIYEPDPRNNGLIVYSDDNGDSWSHPIFAVNSRPAERMRISDPELWLDPHGKLHFYWGEVPYEAGLDMPNYSQKIDMENDSEYHRLEAQFHTYEAVCDDPDAEELVFSKPRRLFNAIMRNHPFVAKSGRWFYPTFLTPAREYYEYYYSDDEGKTFHTTRCPGRALTRNFDEPTFYQLSDDTIAVVMRQRESYLVRTVSTDNGETWSVPEKLVDAASQRPCALNLLNGSIALATSVHPEKRNGMQLWISKDRVNFTFRVLLDDRERVSYAEMVQGPDGTLYVAYDRERNNKIRKSFVTMTSEAAKEILFARIPASVLETGIITPGTVRARIISKARINTI